MREAGDHMDQVRETLRMTRKTAPFQGTRSQDNKPDVAVMEAERQCADALKAYDIRTDRLERV